MGTMHHLRARLSLERKLDSENRQRKGIHCLQTLQMHSVSPCSRSEDVGRGAGRGEEVCHVKVGVILREGLV